MPCTASGVELETFIPWTLVKRRVKKEIITPIDTPEAFREEVDVERKCKRADLHPPILRALGLAYYWESLIDAGLFDSLSAIAAAESISKGRVSQLVKLLRLSPNRVQALQQTPRSSRLE